MGSIAYVADEEMIEYHRLCGNREINFWRLSSQKKFSNFHKGDLLFFYTRSTHSSKKGFAGYAHFDSIQRLSIQGMWKKYGTANGYDSERKLYEAIERASRDKEIPKKMNCLHLKDVVFFRSLVYPEDVGLELSSQLESYYYLDKNDPSITVKLLREAEKVGIDVWSSVYSKETEAVFEKDEIRHLLSSISSSIGEIEYTQTEKAKITKLIQDIPYERIQGSQYDSFQLEDKKLTIIVPFASLTRNKKIRIIELTGRMALYRYYIKEEKMPIESLKFKILTDDEEIEHLQEVFNDERL